jgi:hypothetical protein
MAATEGVPSADDPALEKRLKETRKSLQKSIDAYAVILVLLASITYIGFLQPPGSFDQDGLNGTSSRLRSFVYCNSFSFFFSITELLLCVSGRPDLNTASPTSNKQLARSVVYSLMKLLGVNLLFVVSLSCCMGAYISAGFVVQKYLNIADLETIKISSSIGGSFYILFILLLLFLCTVPTLQFFRKVSDCCSRGQCPCCPWNPCGTLKNYLDKLDERVLANASNRNSRGENGTTRSEPNTGGIRPDQITHVRRHSI